MLTAIVAGISGLIVGKVVFTLYCKANPTDPICSCDSNPSVRGVNVT